MSATWFVHNGTAQEGPLTLEEVQGRVQQGQVKPSHLAWKEGMAQWVKVRDLPELNPPPSQPTMTMTRPPVIPPPIPPAATRSMSFPPPGPGKSNPDDISALIELKSNPADEISRSVDTVRLKAAFAEAQKANDLAEKSRRHFDEKVLGIGRWKRTLKWFVLFGVIIFFALKYLKKGT